MVSAGLHQLESENPGCAIVHTVFKGANLPREILEGYSVGKIHAEKGLLN